MIHDWQLKEENRLLSKIMKFSMEKDFNFHVEMQDMDLVFTAFPYVNVILNENTLVNHVKVQNYFACTPPRFSSLFENNVPIVTIK